MNKFMIEGLDRLGKDTLIKEIQHERGFHQVLHYSKPEVLECYTPKADLQAPETMRAALRAYQEASFRTMFSIMRDAKFSHVICNRAHLGEMVYAPLYRGYDGSYVFELERAFNIELLFNLRLVLLVEDFDTSRHFVDDGESFDITKRRDEQDRFLDAFERSHIADKRIVQVTDSSTGGFKQREQILHEVIR